MANSFKVLFPDRIVNRHVGGNTTYAREVRDGLIARGVETGTIPSGRNPLGTIVKESAAMTRRLEETVLHFSADTGPLLGGRAASVVTIHGVASRWTNVARNPTQEAIWRFRVRRAARATDAIITVSQSAANDISAVFEIDPARVRVIPHGIDHDHFSAPAEVSSVLASALPDQFALYVGNIEPRKNLRQLVRAFESPAVKSLGLPLIVAGRKAWNYEDSMMEIEAAENTSYLGFVSDEDRVALMQRATLFVFPSLYEGFGFPVLEAMAAGAPVLTSHAGSLQEVAGPSRIIDDLTAVGIADGVLSAVADNAWMSTVVDEGRTWASKFRWSASVAEHMKVYEGVLAK